MANPYFLNAVLDQNTKEHELYRNATNEIVQIYGRNFSYIPKTLVKSDYILGEDVLKQFNTAKSITLFIENFSEYSGNGDVFAKFGLSIDDRLDLIVEQIYFKEKIGSVPQIGDLLHDRISDRIFKINHIKYDDSFNQFCGNNMSYKFSCVLWKYSHETLDTGINSVDAIEDETDSNTQDELTQLNSKASEIIDFTDDDYFGNS